MVVCVRLIFFFFPPSYTLAAGVRSRKWQKFTSFGPEIKFLQMFPPFQNGVKEKEKTSYMYLHVGFGPSIHENIFPEEHWILISGFVFVKMLL